LCAVSSIIGNAVKLKIFRRQTWWGGKGGRELDVITLSQDSGGRKKEDRSEHVDRVFSLASLEHRNWRGGDGWFKTKEPEPMKFQKGRTQSL